MDQIAFYNLEKVVDGKAFRLSLMVGAKWEDAIQSAEEFVEKIKELQQLSIQQAAEKAAQQEQAPVEPEIQEEVAIEPEVVDAESVG